MNPVELFPTHVTDCYEALRVVASRWCDAHGDSAVLDAAVPALAVLANLPVADVRRYLLIA